MSLSPTDEDVAEAVKALNLPERDSQASIGVWAAHLRQLLKWNKAFNLTAIHKPQEAIALHLLDSLSIAAFIDGDKIYDIGTGGGFPGLPLAVLFPEKRFILVDASAKKVRFLTQTIKALELKNTTALHARVEALVPDTKADIILSRAFSSLSKFVSLTAGLAGPDTQWLAMKGRNPVGELEELEELYTSSTEQLIVPGVVAERHLITIRRKT